MKGVQFSMAGTSGTFFIKKGKKGNDSIKKVMTRVWTSARAWSYKSLLSSTLPRGLSTIVQLSFTGTGENVFHSWLIVF